MLYPKTTKTRDVYNLNGVWKIKRVEDDFIPLNPITDYSYMAVPASINDIVTDKSFKNYVGKVLYEREFSLPVRKGMIYNLRLSAVSHQCDVFLNGVKIGHGINGFVPVDLPLSDMKEKNRLSVIIDNRLTPHTFPAGRIKDGKQLLMHDFYNFTGIHRDVLIYSRPIKNIEDIEDFTDKAKKQIHKLLIKMLGKNRYNKAKYKLQKIIYNPGSGFKCRLGNENKN